MKPIDLKDRKTRGLLALGALVLAFAGMAIYEKAHAEDAPRLSWNGFWVDAHTGYVTGQADGGGPVGFASNGAPIGAALGVDVQAKQFVMGASVEYNRYLGDVHTIGVDSDITALGRAGILVTPQTLFYGLGGYSWIQTSGPAGHGWLFGGGVEHMLKEMPVSVKAEYRYRIDDFGQPSRIDVSDQQIRFGVAYHFNLNN